MSILFLRQGGSPATPTETTPTDDDADVTVTTRTDRDGATIRPPRVTLLTAADSFAESALQTPQRGPLDEHEVKFDRIGGDEEGTLFRILAYSNRAADFFAIRALELEWDDVPDEMDGVAADTAGGTDADGASMRVPTLSVLTAMDSFRNASLLPAGGTARESRRTMFHAAQSRAEGGLVRVVVQQVGRAGDFYALSALALELDDAPEELARAKEY